MMWFLDMKKRQRVGRNYTALHTKLPISSHWLVNLFIATHMNLK